MPLWKKILKGLLLLIAVLFTAINVVAFFHAWKFSHFNPDNKKRIVADSLSENQKLNMLLFGADVPRPHNDWEPDSTCETVILQSNKKIECWYFKEENSKGTVIIFHGYGDDKSRMLGRGGYLQALGYNVLLVDFQGAGGSEGNTSTIGYDEAQQVKTCVDYIAGKGEKNIHLLGISMGAAATLKAMHDYDLPVKSLILECPFGSLSRAIKNRFKLMGVPSFPFTQLLLFWGSVQTGCNFFSYCPADYAKSVKVPTLLLWGEKDDKVSREEIDDIYNNLQGPKKLITYQEAYHESYLIRYRIQWVLDIEGFLMGVNGESRTVKIDTFYMDESEINSNEYKEYKPVEVEPKQP
jgi:alpha-beta hydrolase superfamily lysophospholipase